MSVYSRVGVGNFKNPKMELPTTPSPSSTHVLRRRKKRSTPTGNAPGSSLSGLNRYNIRVVELVRGSMGFGFTISGQKPCLLRCIVEGSPAEKACLRPGNCLVGVNGKDVSHLAHDEVVGLIGSCNSTLRLHVTDSYFSESSDDDSFQTHHPRPKYPHRPRVLGKTLVKKFPGNTKEECFLTASKSAVKALRDSRVSPRTSRRSSCMPLVPTPKRLPRPPLPYEGENDTLEMPKFSDLPRGHSVGISPSNPHVEIIRVFAHLDNQSGSAVSSSSSNKGIRPSDFPTNSTNDRFNTQSSSGSSTRTHNLGSLRKSSPVSMRRNIVGASGGEDPTESQYQAVVGYIGSIELPDIEEKKRLHALSLCIRRLRLEKRVRSVVLLRIQSNGLSLFGAGQSTENSAPLAYYSSSIIAFCGAYSEDRRFFGLVTCTAPNKNCSCHVFMVEPKLLNHSEHARRARTFGIVCTPLPLPKSGQVLGLQECAEFPATADPILSSILRLHGPNNHSPSALSQRSPSEASNRLESTNSSNSDSGIGFRDDSDRTSARIYDIVEPDLRLPEETKRVHRSPAPRKNFPGSHYRKCLHSGGTPVSRDISCQSQSSDHSSLQEQRPTPCFSVFEPDANSLRKILNMDPESDGGGASSSASVSFKSPRRNAKNLTRDSRPRGVQINSPSTSTPLLRGSSRAFQPPKHLEVSVLVTPPRNLEKRNSMKQMTTISPTASVSSHLTSSVHSIGSPLPHRVALTRNGTRSLDNLCSPEVLIQPAFESSKGTVGSSTPALNQETSKIQEGRDDFWEFKVPQPPKPKMEVNRAEKWSESIEKLLGDPYGLDIFTEFLQHEFSAENIHFYTACQRFKENFSELTQSQRISMASTIFQRFLQNGAIDPVNVDFQARCQVEKALSQPSKEMFDLPLGQVFNLLKFDCYPRFLRSDMFREITSGVTPLPLSVGEPSDSDQDSVKSHKLHQDGRRRSLLPWNIKSRSKNRNKKEMDGLNSDISFIQQTALNSNFEASDHEDCSRRQSYKLCRLILPDNSTTVLPCKPGETLHTTVQRLLEKREFHYAFEVVSVATGKALDLNVELSELNPRDIKEIKVEPKCFLGIELPLGWRVGIRANPTRRVAEVLKTVLSQHSIKLDTILVYDIETDELVDLKWPMGRLDGHNVLVKLKDPKLEEITNQIRDVYEHPGLEDDQTSTRTSSSQTSSSVFRGFLRRSSKKYKRKGKHANHQGNFGGETVTYSSTSNEHTTVSVHGLNQRDVKTLPSTGGNIVNETDEENCHPRTPQRQEEFIASITESPLSLISSDLNLVENSRNRKPIYLTQSVETTKS